MTDGGAFAHVVSPAPYLPFLDRHRGRPPGLWPLEPATWIEVDAAHAVQMARRDRAIARDGRAVADALPGSEAAVTELGDLLVRHLAGVRGYAVGASVRRPDGIEVAWDGSVAALGRLAQEDWLILAEGEDEYDLVAGALCFPAGWTLQDKIGRPLTAVHAPVPHYARTLAARVNRIFAALHVDRPLQRLNYSVAGTAELDCRAPRAQHALTGDGPFLRVERQTLRRLPRTRAVAFSVKTYLTPLADLPPPVRAALADASAADDPAHRAYRHADAFPDALIRG